MSHKEYMEIALAEAAIGRKKGNSPVGSIVVKDGTVVSKGHNLALSGMDITAHAETVAIRNSGRLSLEGCTIYTTYEPCLMCAGAIVFAGISIVVMGGNYNPNWGQYGDYSVDKAFQLVVRPEIQVVRGVLVEECEAITWAWRAEQSRKH